MLIVDWLHARKKMCVGKGKNIIIALHWHLVIKKYEFCCSDDKTGVSNFKTMHARYDGVLYLLTMKICL